MKSGKNISVAHGSVKCIWCDNKVIHTAAAVRCILYESSICLEVTTKKTQTIVASTKLFWSMSDFIPVYAHLEWPKSIHFKGPGLYVPQTYYVQNASLTYDEPRQLSFKQNFRS
jgi:hypothetical protein